MMISKCSVCFNKWRFNSGCDVSCSNMKSVLKELLSCFSSYIIYEALKLTRIEKALCCVVQEKKVLQERNQF
ncbi:CLUMA_CG017367, isoform A [Clunio marinus]|uniref:CLUMA_CG017367, isoform A n=1 Tax=Clunio marinus TaxID=568069 RepID=A0A1J1IVN4_9DIPT|nr:CLUMA_CG017367, isoform A [Clunio marinus]